MAEESPVIDPYDAVIADLRAKRDQIDQAILAIESVRGSPLSNAIGTASVPAPLPPRPNDDGPGALLGMSISEAAKKLLANKRVTLKNNDLATMFRAGGLILNSKDWVNTIGAVLTRRANEVGDIVKVDRGTWGLKEWYPNRSFKKDKEEAKGEDASKDSPKPIGQPPY